MKQKNNWKLIAAISRGQTHHLLLGSLYVVLATVFSYMIPFIVSFTLDYVISGTAISLPAPLGTLLTRIGGRDYLLHHVLLCGGALLLMTLLNGLFTFLRRREIAFASEGMAKTLRDMLYEHLMQVPYDYHKHISTGDLVQRCTSDVDTVRRFVSMQLMEVVRTIIMVILAATVMFSVHTKLALFSTMLMPLLMLSSFVYFHFVRKYFTDTDEAEGALSAMLQENLTGMRVVRAFGQEKAEIDRFTEKNMDYRKKTVKLNNLLGTYWGMSDSVGYLQIAASIIAGIFFVADGSLTLGNLTLFATYTSMLTWPVRQLGRILADMGKAAVSLNRLDEIMQAPVETEPGKALLAEPKGDIVFDKVCFGYDKPDDVLRDISFTAREGQTVGILGSTGSGKTSLVQLLQRLYQTTGGVISIGNVPINDFDHASLRNGIGIVLQEPFLYSRTILENIRMTRPQADEDEVFSAARDASIHDVITSFDQGYQTVVGERGVTLSGGQKQRVAIARTLLKHSDILIFDDSLSAVDAETDVRIRKALLRDRKERITFLISHRINTLQEADFILVLENGQITQRGTHGELMRQPGIYQRIAAIQGVSTEGGSSK